MGRIKHTSRSKPTSRSTVGRPGKNIAGIGVKSTLDLSVQKGIDRQLDAQWYSQRDIAGDPTAAIELGQGFWHGFRTDLSGPGRIYVEPFVFSRPAASSGLDETNWLRPVDVDEPIIVGARHTHNILPSDNFNDWSTHTESGGATIIRSTDGSVSFNSPAGGRCSVQLLVTNMAVGMYLLSVRAENIRNHPNNVLCTNVFASGATVTNLRRGRIVGGKTGNQTYCLAFRVTAAGNAYMRLGPGTNNVGESAHTMRDPFLQRVEDLGDADDYPPHSYTPANEIHHYNITNANTCNSDGEVTEQPGVPIE